MTFGSPPWKGPNYVYAIGAPGYPVKVGYSKWPEKRAVDLQSSWPHRLQVLYAQQTTNASGGEGLAHALLLSRHLTGEWFLATPHEAEAAIRKGIRWAEGPLPDPSEFCP